MSERITLRGELDDLLANDPFVPFEIVMASGDRYRVDGPLNIALGQDIILYAPPDGRYSALRFNQISSIDALMPTTL
jgi:hypothetical protein